MLPDKNDLAIYIHVPFCKAKCRYCDFVSGPGTDEEIDAYVDALVSEIRAAKDEYSKFHVTSIYMGGGTPSILSTAQFEKIVKALEETFGLVRQYGEKGPFSLSGKKQGSAFNYYFLNAVKDFKNQIEFTVECNPGTVEPKKLKVMKNLGVNRISLGLQSNNNENLKMLGRIHTVEDFIDSFYKCRDAGFENINVDLIQALPGQDVVEFMKELYSTMMIGPDHISVYSLIVEDGTPFSDCTKVDKNGNQIFKDEDGNILNFPSEDEDREMYETAADFLEKAGLARYEISNFAKKDRICRHNRSYWKRQNYLGFGISAASMVDNVRWKNTTDKAAYVEACAKGDFESFKEEVQKLSVKDQMGEFMFLGLRCYDGVSKEEFMEYFGVDFDFQYGEITRKFIDEGFMKEEEFEFYNPETKSNYIKTRVMLTDKGINVSNTIMAEYLLD